MNIFQRPWLRLRAGGIALLFASVIVMAIGQPIHIAQARALTRVRAHPLGNFSINHYARLEIAAQNIRLVYIVDQAEIPTFQAREKIDTDQDGSLSNREQQTYLDAEIARYAKNLLLQVNAQPVQLNLTESHIEFPQGQGGLITQRITAIFQTAQIINLADIAFSDNNFSDRLGWQEIVLQAADGVQLQGNNLPTQDQSNELRNYPQDMLQSPLRQTSVRFGLSQHRAAKSQQANANIAAPAARATDPFAELITTNQLSFGAAAFALLMAFVWGGAHALSPGHGKTIVGAYVVGSRATAKHAVFLGATTTLTHTAGVFAVGLVTLFASNFILPEKLYPWLEVVSGALVVVLGVALLRGRVASLVKTFKYPNYQTPAAHAHANVVGVHDHGDGFAHKHTLPTAAMSWRSLFALGVSGGLIPCPSALVVMLSAIALNRVAFGLALIFVFSLGLAVVLMGIGIALVHASQLLDTASKNRFAFVKPVMRYAPLVSAAFITLAGLGITWRALASTGLINGKI